MRQLVTIAVLLLVAGVAQAVGGEPVAEVFVKARLIALDRAPDCGVVFFGSPATYEVIAGPAELVGKKIHVVVDCAEMPRAGTAADHGDLKAFVIGATHFLALTKENTRGIESPNTLPSEGVWFYLRAASLEDLCVQDNRIDCPVK